MNNFIGIGRITRDIEVRTTANGKTYARFNLAIDRGRNATGEDMGTDYPSCVIWGRSAETLARLAGKGTKIAVQGRITTGSYDKGGEKVYTTDVMVDRWEFAQSKEAPKPEPQQEVRPPFEPPHDSMEDKLISLPDDIYF